MVERLLAFVAALRRAGVPVSVAETIDATQSLRHIPVHDRMAFKAALAATLIKRSRHRPTFDQLFNIYFDGAGPPEVDALTDAAREPMDADQMMRALQDAIASGSGNTRELASMAVTSLGRIENSPSDSLYFEYPVFRSLDLELLLSRLLEDLEKQNVDPLTAALQRRAFQEAIALFRSEVSAEVRRRVARRRGVEVVERSAVRPLPEDIDLATAPMDEIDELRRAVRPLARKLAARTSMRKRRSHRGGLDARKTFRRSLSTGGVPLEVELRRRPPHRPELFVLCDVSSSVARFSRFSLMLVHALSSQFSKVRSFVFVDALDEVTKAFERYDLPEAIAAIDREADVIHIDGHSDYGNCLRSFENRFGGDITARSTIVILGDARTNYRRPREESLMRLKHSAKHIYWLNPEPETFWDSGDSAASRYAAHCDGMFEVRTLRMLERAVEKILV
ncbi:MAG: vWA domain-containing protein [Actinomycetota bacterium]